MATSPKILGTEFPMKKFLWLMHFGGGVIVGSQKPWTGIQENIATNSTAIPQRTTNTPTRFAASSKGLTGKRPL